MAQQASLVTQFRGDLIETTDNEVWLRLDTLARPERLPAAAAAYAVDPNGEKTGLLGAVDVAPEAVPDVNDLRFHDG
eukprot:CAMPEP_0170191814 /NCGR_PEP_ID=MMETSP0040_2-20121228/52645_1 /TAXON_ID=641309 /ORGANISM="Lotharella oceanica, Strain CCMP622" /LENGTH=76 /DNA_ID=CAMNT_0010439983 /DNA_START=60 /DNA_END=287 /DNA_ORIENTATION=-